jgi:hypothetical protein
LQLVLTTAASAKHDVVHLEKKANTECSGSEHSSHESSDHTSENCIFCAHGSAIFDGSSIVSVIVILPVTESGPESLGFHISQFPQPLPSLRGPPDFV